MWGVGSPRQEAQIREPTNGWSSLPGEPIQCVWKTPGRGPNLGSCLTVYSRGLPKKAEALLVLSCMACCMIGMVCGMVYDWEWVVGASVSRSVYLCFVFVDVE